MFPWLVHSLNGHNGQNWAGLKPRTRSFFQVSQIGAGVQAWGLPLLLSLPGTVTESWIEIRAIRTQIGIHMGCQCYRQQLCPCATTAAQSVDSLSMFSDPSNKLKSGAEMFFSGGAVPIITAHSNNETPLGHGKRAEVDGHFKLLYVERECEHTCVLVCIENLRNNAQKDLCRVTSSICIIVCFSYCVSNWWKRTAAWVHSLASFANRFYPDTVWFKINNSSPVWVPGVGLF